MGPPTQVYSPRPNQARGRAFAPRHARPRARPAPTRPRANAPTPCQDACGLNGEPKGQEPAHMKLGLSFVDGLHCLLTPFFLDCVASPAGRFFVSQSRRRRRRTGDARVTQLLGSGTALAAAFGERRAERSGRGARTPSCMPPHPTCAQRAPETRPPQVLKTLEVLIALMALMAIEDSRSSARGLVRGSVIVLATAQLVGASVAIPFAWVPCYLLLTKPHVEGAFLPAGKVRGWRGGKGVGSHTHA